MGGLKYPEIASIAGEEALPQPDDSENEETARLRSIMGLDLPMIIKGSTIISRPDSGAENNIIAMDVLSALNLKMDTAPKHRKMFRLANGKSVWALGRVVILCAFAKNRTLELCCTFYVFQNLTSQLIMGMPFLDETQTLVKYRYRFQPRIIPMYRPIQLNSLNSPRRRLYCLVDSQPELANADTGSDLNVMSLDYMKRRGFAMTAVGLSSPTIQFADGSTSELEGRVSVSIVLGPPEGPGTFTTFYVLDGLTSDIILGEDFLEKTTAFETYRDAFSIIDCDDDAAEVNGIIWFNKVESYLSRGMDALALESKSTSGNLRKTISGMLRYLTRLIVSRYADCFQSKRKKMPCAVLLIVDYAARRRLTIIMFQQQVHNFDFVVQFRNH